MTVPLVAKRYGWPKRRVDGRYKKGYEYNVTAEQLNEACDGKGRKFIKWRCPL